MRGDNEDIRAMVNAGHRKGATAGRCVVRGTTITTEELPSYSAVALAGIGTLPDTLMSRSVSIWMRKRGPGESIEPFRPRLHQSEGHALREQLADWMASICGLPPWPTVPSEITDRDEDKWEALLIVGERAGGDWPERARSAAVTLVTDVTASRPTLGVQLLTDLLHVFTVKGVDKLFTETILRSLNSIVDSPWGSLQGRPLDARRLAGLLRPFGVLGGTIRVGEQTGKGYQRAALQDPWLRYVPSFTATP